MTPEYKKLIEDIKRRPLSALAGQRTTLKKSGSGKFKGCCPLHTEKTPSFHVNDDKGTFRCYGCSKGGDAIEFLMLIDNVSFGQAVEHAAAFYGLMADKKGVRKKTYAPLPPAETPEEEQARRRREIEKARSIWAQGLPADGTIVEDYLRRRKINIETLPGGIIPPNLRYHPRLRYWYQSERTGQRPQLLGWFPAMIAPLEDYDGQQMGLHITYIDPATAGKLKRFNPDDSSVALPAKKMIGNSWACCIRLGALQEYMSCSEGIENGLSAMCCGAPPALVAASLGNIAGRGIGEGMAHPRRLDKKLPAPYPDLNSKDFMPPFPVKRFLLIRDNDSKDQESADVLFDRGMQRISTGGIAVEDYTPDKGMDMNDMVQRGLLKYASYQEAHESRR